MTITLAEAIPLRKVIERRIYELQNERTNVSVLSIEKGEQYDAPVRNVDVVTNEIHEAQKEYRTLQTLISRANLDHHVEWDGGELSLTEAIELAKQMRNEIEHFKRLGNRKKIERESGRRGLLGDGNSHLLSVAQYEPEEYRVKALKFERQSNKLSALIERKNHFVELNFDASHYID
jgi:hypothetical protein